MTYPSRRALVTAGAGAAGGVLLAASPAAAALRTASRTADTADAATAGPAGPVTDLVSLPEGHTAALIETGGAAREYTALAFAPAPGDTGRGVLAASCGPAAEPLAAPALALLAMRGSGAGWEREPGPARLVSADAEVGYAGPLHGGHRRLAGGGAVGVLGNGPLAATGWGSVLVGEETFADHLGTVKDGWSRREAHWRYDVTSAGARDWSRLDRSYDIGVHRELPHRFGWIAEIDPADPAAAPVKRTALGRIRHAGICMAESRGRAVVYLADGDVGGYLYKFVSRTRTGSAGAARLDDGVLHVARLDADGTGRWLPLLHGRGPLTSRNGWLDQADVLLRTRLAADALGATALPSPGRMAADPLSQEVSCTLAAECHSAACGEPSGGPSSRGTGRALPVLDGNALRWTEHDGDPAARRFRWSTDAAWDATRPRELRTDRLGRLWAATTHTVRVSGPKAGTAQPLLTARHGAEFTAITFTPDARTLFAGVRLPGAAGGCAVLAVRHREDRPVGTA